MQNNIYVYSTRNRQKDQLLRKNGVLTSTLNTQEFFVCCVCLFSTDRCKAVPLLQVFFVRL